MSLLFTNTQKILVQRKGHYLVSLVSLLLRRGKGMRARKDTLFCSKKGYVPFRNTLSLFFFEIRVPSMGYLFQHPKRYKVQGIPAFCEEIPCPFLSLLVSTPEKRIKTYPFKGYVRVRKKTLFEGTLSIFSPEKRET